jgi:hypothetical protein
MDDHTADTCLTLDVQRLLRTVKPPMISAGFAY